MIDKREVLKLLRAKLEGELARFTTSQTAAQEGATHEETRQEDPKDTRAIEAQYLARGLAERVELTQDSVTQLARLKLQTFGPGDRVDVTALVALENERDEESVYFLVPCAGGETIVVDDVEVRTLTPGSPLGEAMRGTPRESARA